MNQKKIMLAFGTRPEAIKMAPLLKEFLKYTDTFQPIVCVTAQHREMLDQVLRLFEIKPDYDLNIMKNGQDLYDLTSGILIKMRDVLQEVKPDLVLVHGDTTTSAAVALAAFYQQIPVGHVEAGLRTGNIYSPYPEEMNRQLTGRLATYHFAPTALSRKNLIAESVNKENIVITGNTVIDALYWVLQKISESPEVERDIQNILTAAGYDSSRLNNARKMILITGHRRENFGAGFQNICMAVKTLCYKYPHTDFVYPMHLNPHVRRPIREIFGSRPPDNMFFIEPLDYLPFVYLMQHCYLILTDSGGIQEEAPALGKPVIVMRNTTERPEAISAGTVKLTGTDYDRIITETSLLLDDPICYDAMHKKQNPYGDGFASKRIASFLIQTLTGKK